MLLFEALVVKLDGSLVGGNDDGVSLLAAADCCYVISD
jgi:hypothetical protein